MKMSRLTKNSIIIDGITRESLLVDDFTIPPTPSDTYCIITAGDRLDILSQKYYGDPTLWWIIAHANNLKDTINITEDLIIRIPGNRFEAISLARSSLNNSSIPVF